MAGVQCILFFGKHIFAKCVTAFEIIKKEFYAASFINLKNVGLALDRKLLL